MDILDRIQVVQSRQDFRMCVPPQQDDTDVVLEDCRKEIESLRQQLADMKSMSVCVACSEISAVGEYVAQLEQQLAAALAACEAKDDCLLDCAGNINPERGYADELELDIAKALAIKPDASALKAHDEALIERCAEVCEEYQGSAETCAAAIRELKSQL